MADFQFYLNTQGLRGRSGLKGDAGFSPTVTIGQNTLNTFTLIITTQNGTFETPNLRGSIINNAGAGTYLRYDAESDSIYLGELEQASETTLGGVNIANEESLLNGDGSGAITAEILSSGIYGRLVAGDNIKLSLDEETQLITVSATSGDVSFEPEFKVTKPLEKATKTQALFMNGVASEDYVTLSGIIKTQWTNLMQIATGKSTHNGMWLDCSRGAIFLPIEESGGYWYGVKNLVPDTNPRNYYEILTVDWDGDSSIKPVTWNNLPYYTNPVALFSFSDSNEVTYNNSGYFEISPTSGANGTVKTFTGTDNTLAVYINKDTKTFKVFYESFEVDFSSVVHNDAWASMKYIMVGNIHNANVTSSLQIDKVDVFKNSAPSDASHEAVVNNYDNLVDITKALTIRTLSLRYDNQTLQVNSEGQLVVNMDEIGGDVSALSTRVTTLEDTVNTMETTITDMQGTIETLTNRVTELETEINGGNA